MPDLVGIEEKLVRQLRGSIFQSVILFYLDFVKEHHGIKRCNFFASSPFHGSECYIFNHRPNPNLQPKKQRQMSLIKIYDSIVKRGEELGIVKKRAYIDEELNELSKTSSIPLLNLWQKNSDFWPHVPELLE